MRREFHVEARWDDEARVWYVSETDVPGLVAEAATIPDLFQCLASRVPEMLELNAHLLGGELGGLPDVPYSVMVRDIKGSQTLC